MYSNYQYQIFKRPYEDGFGPRYIYGFVTSIDDAYKFILNESLKLDIAGSDENLINQISNIPVVSKELDDEEEIIVISSKFYGFEFVIKKFAHNYIHFLLDKFNKNIINEIEEIEPNTNFNKVNVYSLYLVKVNQDQIDDIKQIPMIKLTQSQYEFKKYQKKFFNMNKILSFDDDNCDKFVDGLEKDKISSHVEILPMLKWFLQNHFIKKVLDNQFVENKINLAKDFVVDFDVMDFDFDTDTDSDIIIIESKYLIKFI